MPTDAPVRWVLIEETDLVKMFIVPSIDWYPDTGGTFRLVDTAENLRPGRGMVILPQVAPLAIMMQSTPRLAIWTTMMRQPRARRSSS
jgi:hypothetical protein